VQRCFFFLPHRATGNHKIGMANNANKLFPDRQSSYRRGHSTETAVLCVHNDLVHAIDEQRITGLVMLDLSAVFDTVDHSILLSVLERDSASATPLFRGSDHICLTEPRPSTSTATHLINYQSAALFHKALQPDRLSSSPTRKTCPRCSTVTEFSIICMPTTSRRMSTLRSLTFLQLVRH